MSGLVRASDDAALCAMVRQTELSGAARRAALLHVDRLPHCLAKPHHLRLARQALHSLAKADRAQSFDLARGRMAIVWRGDGGKELEIARGALGLLVSGQIEGEVPAPADLLTAYDLPRDAEALLDDVAGAPYMPRRAVGTVGLDLRMLDRLETGLAQADLSSFARHRRVVVLPPSVRWLQEARPTMVTAWHERYFAVHELAADLCPERQLRSDPWLFRRLTRTLDARLLAMLGAPQERRDDGRFAINVNVATMLGPEFLRFDDGLPLALRGEVILILRAADILADPTAFAFARNFARARLYRLALGGATPALLRFLDVHAAGFDIVQIALTPELRERPESICAMIPTGIGVVLTGLHRPSDVRWAVEHGFRLGRGRAFSP